VDPTFSVGSFDAAAVDSSLAYGDPGLVDHPRCTTVDHIREQLPAEHRAASKTFMVTVLHTLTSRSCSPQFIILQDKIPGRDCFRRPACTCGTGIRTGVPCRHFWAVLRSSTYATFHTGLLNDLWFKAPQLLGVSTAKLFAFDNEATPSAVVSFNRSVSTKASRTPYRATRRSRTTPITGSSSPTRDYGG